MDQDYSPDEIPLHCQPEDVARFFEEMSEKLRRIAWALLRDWELAEDAVQETFTLFSQRSGGITVQQAPGWLVKTLQFQALNLRRRLAREKHHRQQHSFLAHERPDRGRRPSDADATWLRPEQTQDQQLQYDETILALRNAVEALPDEQRDVVNRRLHQQQTFAEISATTNTPIGTVLSRMRLALRRLTKELRKDE